MAQAVFFVDALLSYLAGSAMSETNDMMVYLVGSILSALYLGQIPALLSGLSALATLREVIPQDPWQYPISVAMFLFTTNQIAILSDSTRRESWRKTQRGEVLGLLNEFSQQCSEVNSLEQVKSILENTLKQRLSRPIVRLSQPQPDCLTLQGAVICHGWLEIQGFVPPFKRALATELAEIAAHTMDRIVHAENEHRTSMLEATQKLQSALINSLSHDLQTPLAAILGVFEALQSKEASLSPEQSEKLVALGHQQSERLLHQLRNLLNIGKLEAGALKLSRTSLSLRDLVRSAVRALSPSDSQRILLHCNDDPEVSGDATLLHQVVFNLLDNALKFSPANQKVEVEVSIQGAFVCMEVRDRGFGVSPEDRQHIFERFYRGVTPCKIPGSGLGLHISMVLAELHGGSLVYLPREPEGSIFQFNLPAVKE